MKNRILTFITGILTGAIITTAGFLFYSKTMNKNIRQNKRIQINSNGQMQPPNEDLGKPPTKPESDFQERMQNNNI